MRLNDDFNDLNKSKNFAIAASISIAAIVLVVAFVLISNYSVLKKKNNVLSVSSTVEDLYENENEISFEPDPYAGITVSDLDFFDMYKEENGDDGDTVSDKDSSTDTESENSNDISAEQNDITKDGKHFSLTNSDGTVEWITISPNFAKNDYDITNLLNSGGKLKYFEDNVCISKLGVDVSKEQDYIDFTKVKKAGIDFVMLRVATRGYQSGQINTDDYFEQNIKRASDAGLEIGVYFVSNAITEEEAIEEANYLVNMIGDYKLTYPVAFVYDYVNGDSSRIDKLTKSEKTSITRAFLNTIKAANLKPVVYGRKEWLVKEVDLSKLIGDYDFWLSDTISEFPDYPYKYSIWQYSKEGSVDGIAGKVNLNLCFNDYSLK